MSVCRKHWKATIMMKDKDSVIYFAERILNQSWACYTKETLKKEGIRASLYLFNEEWAESLINVPVC